MSVREIGTWLMTRPGFLLRLDRVTIDSAIGELGSKFSRTHPASTHDWSYLLLAASALTQGADAASQAAALRIAHTALSSTSATEPQRRSAALVLDALANQQAIELAVSRKNLSRTYEDDFPFAALAETQHRERESTLLGSKHPIRVNRFQRRLWNELNNNNAVSISAPTSSGKSFVLARWILAMVKGVAVTTIVYLVPTRALISQVEADLKKMLIDEEVKDVTVSAMPFLPEEESLKRIFVFTQERLQILLNAVDKLEISALVVDEAHKVGDSSRGVLLQQLIERVSEENKTLRLAFASPMTSNPELLISDLGHQRSKTAFISTDVTVSQNLFWVYQKKSKPKQWAVEICLRGQRHAIGEIALDNNPTPEAKRLPFVAYAIGQLSHGNVVYVNGAADAEKTALQLYELIGELHRPDNKELSELIDLSTKIVHKDYLLSTVLSRGVAFHYGNMPLLLKSEIERLFSSGVIKYLVCTSTLVEGVNLSCRNVFVRNPKKGSGNLMTAEDFWNLAGRAGRWGKEFQGNIFCIDATRSAHWQGGSPPLSRGNNPIRRATDTALDDAAELIRYANDEGPIGLLTERPELDYVLSYLGALHFQFNGIENAPWRHRFTGNIAQLSEAVRDVVAKVALPGEVLSRNSSVSPFAMRDLLNILRTHQGDPEELLPSEPSSVDAVDTYTGIFKRLSARVAPKLGPDGRSFMLALLVVKWMRGYPLSRLIGDRLSYLRSHGRELRVANEIRAVMADVEQIARFEAPRGLSCYRDVLSVYFLEIGRNDLVAKLPDLGIYLELGVSIKTQISLIGIGLSRTAAIMISELMHEDSLSETAATAWLRQNTAIWRANSDLPNLVRREIADVLEEDLDLA